MNTVFHPRPDDYGKPVKINKPSKTSPLSHFDYLGEIVAVLPDGEVPESLNGIRFESWADAPVTMAEWLTGSGQGDFAEPPMAPEPGKKLSAGVVTVEPDGRVWAVSPTNQFGGYSVTFPKGTIDAGMTAKSAAIREALEESGLQVELTALIGDFERTTSVTRYYLAKRVSGNPADCGWESQCVWLIPKERLLETLSHPADKPLIEKVLAMLA